MSARSRRTEGPAARSERPRLGGRGAALGPGDLHAARRRRGARAADGHAGPPRPREVHRRRARAAARRAGARDPGPALRLGRGLAGARDAPRVRPRDQGAGRVRLGAERARRALLPGVDRGPPGERLRPRAPAAREDPRSLAPARRLLPRLRVHRRPAHRLLRLRHEGRLRARPVRRAARAPGAAGARHHRAAARRRLRACSSTRPRPSSWPSASR